MSKTAKAFENGKAFIPFITAGDPDLKTTKELILTMAENGADLIEIGIPFSDPVAEGIVIQQADLRALASGTTTDKIFDMIAEVRQELPYFPLAIMTYINPVFVYGCEKFMAKCEQLGIDCVIVPDIPYEEKQELAPYCDKHGVDLISLIAPTSEERIKMIAAEAQGFLYCVSSMGVTGVRKEIDTDIESMINSVREVSNIPTAIGFGISTPDQARQMAKYADGVIVGSAIVRICAQHGKYSAEPVKKYVREMKAAISEN